MHLASGDVDVQRSVLPEGEAGVDETVDKMVELAKGEYGAKSAKIRALAINIIDKASVGDKDYYGMAKAIHNWVRDQIRYVKDPLGQETLSYPEEMAFNTRAGDCDDKTILEMGLLGSLGIRSYPVVVGVRPGSFSHVYLNIVIPDGGRPGTHAGEHIPADPIMREWPLGQEAPAHKITQKKTYEHLAGLGAMDLGAYYSGPAYIDESDVSSVKLAMHAPLVDTASRGEILNAPKVNEPNTDELDDMFSALPVLAFKQEPWLGPLGPVTGAQAAGDYDRLGRARTYERVRMPGKRSFKPRTSPVQRALPGKASDGVMVDAYQTQQEDEALVGLGVYIDSIMGDAMGDEPVKAIAKAHLARKHVQQTERRMHAKRMLRANRAPPGSMLPGIGEIVESRSDRILALAHHLKSKCDDLLELVAAKHGDEAVHSVLDGLVGLELSGAMDELGKQRKSLHIKAKAIQIALYHMARKVGNRPMHGDWGRSITPPLFRQPPKGMFAHGRGVPDTELAGLGSFFSKLKSLKPKKLLSVAALANPAAWITAGGASLIPGKSKQLTKKLVLGSLGQKWGDRYIRTGRVEAVAAASAATFAAAAAANPVIAANAADLGMTPAAYAVQYGGAYGLATLAPAALAIGTPLAIGAAAALAKPLSQALKGKKKPGDAPTYDAEGLLTTSAVPLAQAAEDPLLTSADMLPYQDPNQYQDPWADGSGDPGIDAAGGAPDDMMESATGAAPPVDTFGPEDMSAPEQSAIAVSSPDTGPQVTDDMNLVDDSDDSDDEGSPEGSDIIVERQASRGRRMRRRGVPASQAPDAPEDDTYDADSDGSDGDDTDALDIDSSVDDNDVSGLGAEPSMMSNPLFLLAVGVAGAMILHKLSKKKA